MNVGVGFISMAWMGSRLKKMVLCSVVPLFSNHLSC